jgi:hypothetical protein
MMNEVLQANIFFFIASVATVVFCLFVCLILYHVYKIARSVRHIVERIEAGSELIAEDVAFVRSFMKGGLARVLGLFAPTARTRARRGRKEAQESPTDNEEEL